MEPSTPSEIQDIEMEKIGFPHRCNADEIDTEENYRSIDVAANGVGWTIQRGIAYEEDGITVKKGYMRIFYN